VDYHAATGGMAKTPVAPLPLVYDPGLGAKKIKIKSWAKRKIFLSRFLECTRQCPHECVVAACSMLKDLHVKKSVGRAWFIAEMIYWQSANSWHAVTLKLSIYELLFNNRWKMNNWNLACRQNRTSGLNRCRNDKHLISHSNG